MRDIQFEQDEFAYLARELRANGDHGPAYKALLSNNYNVILAALDIAAAPGKADYVQPHVDDKELFLRVVGAILDHPSVFMGGASQQSRRRAERIWDELHFGRYGWKLTRDAATPQVKERTENGER